MRARCERHNLALGPGGCLLCRREQGADAASEAAAVVPVAAPPAAAPAAPVAATAAAAAAAPAAAAGTPLPDPPHAAPALVTDGPPPRQLSIQIPRSVVVLLPLTGLAMYLLVAVLPKSATPVEAASAKTELAAPAQQPVPAPPSAADAPADGDTADDGEHAAVDPEVAPADLARLRERTRQAQQLTEARERVKVTLFYTERCPHCSEARGYLTAHGVRAEQYDIDKDPKARARYLRLNPKGSLPTLVVEKQVLAGFDADRLEHALDRAARARLAPAAKRRRH